MRTFLAALLALAASLSLATRTSATVFIYGNMIVLASGNNPFLDDFRTSPFSHQFTSTETYVFGMATVFSAAAATGQADYGWVRVATSASAEVGAVARDQSRIGSASYEVYAGFMDTITIDAPGLTGQTATMRIGMDLEGTLSAGGWPEPTSGAGGEVNFYLYGPGGGQHQVAVYNSDERVQHFLGGNAQIVFGTPFSIHFVVALTGGADAASVGEDGPGLAAGAIMIADFQNTFTWTGIQDLRDAGGEPVLDFTVTSLSGTDYRDRIVPVPESGTALPVLAGLAALARQRRR
jgi:hypothetical protein